MTTINYSLSKIQPLAKVLLDTWKPNSIVIFHGNPGVGKSTLIYELIKLIETKTWHIQSPTFTKINEYDHVIHMDLYYDINCNYEYYTLLNKWIFIEWGDEKTIPWNYKCELKLDKNNHRILTWIANIH